MNNILIPITRKQRGIQVFIEVYKRQFGLEPSQVIIAEHFKITRSAVNQQIQAMKKRAYAKKIDRMSIPATTMPDFDYVIDRLLDLAEKQNEIIDVVNGLHSHLLKEASSEVKTEVLTTHGNLDKEEQK